MQKNLILRQTQEEEELWWLDWNADLSNVSEALFDTLQICGKRSTLLAFFFLLIWEKESEWLLSNLFVAAFRFFACPFFLFFLFLVFCFSFTDSWARTLFPHGTFSFHVYIERDSFSFCFSFAFTVSCQYLEIVLSALLLFFFFLYTYFYFLTFTATRQDMCSGIMEKFRIFRTEKTYAVKAGKWYFEFEAVTAGDMRVGWTRPGCLPDQELGSDEEAFVFDGFKVCLC